MNCRIEVICRSAVRVRRVGDFLVDEQVDRLRFMKENEKVMMRGPAVAGHHQGFPLNGSFISAVWFQEPTRLLTEAAIAGLVGYLHGLKEL